MAPASVSSLSHIFKIESFPMRLFCFSIIIFCPISNEIWDMRIIKRFESVCKDAQSIMIHCQKSSKTFVAMYE